jgi:HD-like signal output (HDOD) protein
VAVAHFCGAVVKRLKLAMPDAFAAGLLHRVGHLYILVQLARQEASRPRVALSRDIVDAWHPAIAKAVLKNWHVNDAVCEAVGMQADVLAVRSGPPTLTDVLIVGIRLANRMMNSGDTSSFSSGGVLARLNLSIEECRGLIGEAEAEVRALARALHS